jgi:di/tricarboxylate transporter
MSWQAWFTLVLVMLTVLSLARDFLSPAAAVLGATILFMVTGIITPAEAFEGFSNPAPITVAALFVLARAVEKTGAMQPIVQATLGNGMSTRTSIARLAAPVAGASALLNNTPIVAMLAPQVAAWAEKRGKSASLFLMPLSFATMLGGVITLIGTSTNLVVSGLMESQGMAPIGMFELTKIGLPVAIIGLIVIVMMAPIVLPARRTARQQFEDEAREFVCKATIAPAGPLDGQTVESAGLRGLQGVYLAELEREEQVIAPVAPTTVLRGGDWLTFAGRVDTVRDLRNMRGLVTEAHEHSLTMNGSGHTFYEAVISGASEIRGKTLKEIDFRSRYQAAVLAIHRAGQRVNAKLGTVQLHEGDTLLLLADAGFKNRWADRNDFLLIAHLGGDVPASSKHAWLATIVMLTIVGLAGAGVLPILHASLLGVMLLVGAKVLSAAEARAAIDLDVIIVIAASFGIAAAIQGSGLAALLGTTMVRAFEQFGPQGVLLAVTIATLALTELITNNAAAALLFPVGIATANALGVDPRPFAIAITVAASMAFLTPIGYQTNTMVYGLGGYRFGDYARLGAPLTFIVALAIWFLVPLFWSF